MALEIIEGKVVFKYNLGTGAAIITGLEDVSDGKWHEAIAERSVTLALATPSSIFQSTANQLESYVLN